jgi:hypothetical protein
MATTARILTLTLGAMLAAGPALAQQNDPSFRVTNNASATLNEIYVSSSRDNSWGPDRLGDRALRPGGSYVVRLPTGQCVNDIRVVFANGQAMERKGVNTCRLTDLVFP